MRKSLLFMPVLLSSCAHYSRAPRHPPADLGNGTLMYSTWGHTPEKVRKKLERLGERYCGSLGATFTVDKLDAITPGRPFETEMLFHCSPLTAGAPPAGHPKDDADAAQEDLEKEEDAKESR